MIMQEHFIYCDMTAGTEEQIKAAIARQQCSKNVSAAT
jgi:hypothetical protein